MTLRQYMRLYEQAEFSRVLYMSWEDFRKTLNRLMKRRKCSEELYKSYKFISEHCEILRKSMKQAEETIRTDEAKEIRRKYAEEIHEWRIKVNHRNDESDYRADRFIAYEEPIDYISLGMGI